MMLLNSTDTPLYRRYLSECPEFFGYFISIRKYSTASFITKRTAPWAADNDCYNRKFEPASFVIWLTSLQPYSSRCLLVTVPDVVGDANATLAQFRFWRTIIKGLGFPCALALQDGIQLRDIPWNLCDAVFVGGTTDWKMSQEVLALLKESQTRHKWRHIGRVNSFTRMFHFWDFADSFDGTGFAREPDGKLLKFLPMMKWRKQQRRLL